MNLEQAKSAYGLIVAGAQVGAICGPTVVTALVEDYGVPLVYFLGACCMALMSGMAWLYTNKFGIQDESAGDNRCVDPRNRDLNGCRLSL